VAPRFRQTAPAAGPVNAYADLADLIGQRLVVRYHLAGGGYSDALGFLTAWTPAAVTIATRRGPVVVERQNVAIARVVPQQSPKPPLG
jgi:hypothetical protein